MLPEVIENFLLQAPVSLETAPSSALPLSHILQFYEKNIAPQVINKTYGELLHAALMLAHNYIWEAHEIIQVHPQVEASWWHAFMHRMEGDYGNSAYWYHRVSAPQDFINFKNILNNIDIDARLASLKEGSSWQPLKFNELLGRYKKSLPSPLQQIHQLEFIYLFNLTYSKSIV